MLIPSEPLDDRIHFISIPLTLWSKTPRERDNTNWQNPRLLPHHTERRAGDPPFFFCSLQPSLQPSRRVTRHIGPLPARKVHGATYRPDRNITGVKPDHPLTPQEGGSDVGWGTELTFFFLFLIKKSGKSKGNYTHCVSRLAQVTDIFKGNFPPL